MITGVVIFVFFNYLLMVAAFYLPHKRYFHIPVMVTAILIDIAMPFYLVMTRDWYQRLIVEEDIFTFLISMHVMAVFLLYVLYFLQVQTALKIIKGEVEDVSQVRLEHRNQGKGILLVRALVLMMGFLLAEEPS